MDKKELAAIKVFEQAVDLSRSTSNLFLVNIAWNQGLPKSFYYEWAGKSDTCAELFDLIRTNLERTVHSAVRLKDITPQYAMFMLDREFSITNTTPVTTIKIEGVDNKEVEEIIKKINK